MNKKHIFILGICLVILVQFIIVSNIYNSKSTKAMSNSLKQLKIKKDFITCNYSKKVKIVPKFIVIHDTNNKDKGANAKANRNYFQNCKWARASAHYIVDENNIIQALEDNWYGWHCGEKYNGIVNNGNSIGIELCVNKDNDFDKTFKKGVLLTKYLMKKYNIDASHVVRHHDVTGKMCPQMMIKEKPYLWKEFKKEIGDKNFDKENNSFKINKKYKEKELKGYVKVSSMLAIRKGCGTNFKIVGYLQNGKEVIILKQRGNWYKIKCYVNKKCLVGYVDKKYIKK